MSNPTQSNSPAQSLASKAQVIFLHGLNTYGDDVLHIGPRTFGRMDRELRPELLKLGVEIHSVDGIGRGSPEEQAELVFQWLNQKAIEEVLSPEKPLILLGNSLGGLVARVVAHHKSPWHIPLLISWGTPHRGTVAADFSNRMKLQYPAVSKVARAIAAGFQYDLDEKDLTFRHYTPKAMDTFNLKYPRLQSPTREVSLLCRVPLQDVAPCFWPLYPYIHDHAYWEMARGFLFDLIDLNKDAHAPSDGFVPVGSQSWGETLGDFRLDHFVQMGFVELLPREAQREHARSQFRDLVKTIAALIREASSS